MLFNGEEKTVLLPFYHPKEKLISLLNRMEMDRYIERHVTFL